MGGEIVEADPKARPVQLAGERHDHSELWLQAQIISRRFGVSPSLSILVVELLRGGAR